MGGELSWQSLEAIAGVAEEIIHPSGATRVFLVCAVTDMCKSFISLNAIVKLNITRIR